jgi:two-component system OmpR family response regulator
MRILLIEDDENVADLVITGLSEAGHSITHAADEAAGRGLALATKFDAMIFDRQLPGGADSVDLAQTMRARGITTPVLFLSGLGGLQNWIKGLDAGGDDYIVKPFSLDDLRSRVEALYQPATT